MSVPLSKISASPVSPYDTPNASLTTHADFESYNTQPFYATQGRIGRVRYIAYGILVNLILIAVTIVGGVLAALLVPLFGEDNPIASLLSILLIVILFVGQFYSLFAPAKRRLNDLNKTGWISLLLMVPLVGLFFWLYLVFAPGDEGVNEYGAPAAPPSTLMIVLAAVTPFIFIALLGILAAIAVPAYQDYVQRAQAEQTMSDML